MIEEIVKSSSRLILALIVLAALMSVLIYFVAARRRASEKRLEKCKRAINNAKKALDSNDIYKAKQFYDGARNLADYGGY